MDFSIRPNFQKITKQIVSEICKATEDKIPNAAKIEYRRWIGENILQDNRQNKLAGKDQKMITKKLLVGQKNIKQ